MFWNRVLRIIRKGETNVPLYKIGHISENTFGQDSKHIQTINMFLLRCPGKKNGILYTFKINSRFFPTGITVKVAWILAKYKRSISDGELVNDCIMASMSVLLEGYANHTEILHRIRHMQLSR